MGTSEDRQGQGLISDDVINQIRDRVDIAEIAWANMCTDAGGQNPQRPLSVPSREISSFTVSSSRQIFHCFGCGPRQMFTFLMKLTERSSRNCAIWGEKLADVPESSGDILLRRARNQ